MIKLENINKSFQENEIIKDLSIHFLDNHNYLIIGDSGIGKTTLLNIITKQTKPDTGMTTTSGTISMSFQQPRLFEGYSILKNITLFSRLPKNEIESIIRLVINVDPNQQVKSLSGGQKQRVSVLRALLNDSDILILDEPFTGLDGSTTKVLLHTIIKYKNERTLIIVSHNITIFNDLDFEIINLNR